MAEISFAIAAAGTGGHVFPGLAVAGALVDHGVTPDQVLFIGGRRLEAEAVPAAGFPFLSVELRGLQRRLTTANLGIPLVVARAVRRIGEALEDRDTDVLLGMGGYVTVPAVLAARQKRVSAMVSEQNAEAGLANRFSSRLAHRVFGAFPHTDGLPRAEWVGNPIRSEIATTKVDRDEASNHYGLDPGLPTLGVIGGSLGAKSINEAITEMVQGWETHDTRFHDAGSWKRMSPIQILHLAGERAAADLEPIAEKSDLSWRVIGFEPHMERFYRAVNLVVSRAGGMVAELTATHTPSILVPGRFGSGRHQEQNALVLERHGAAVTLGEDRLGRLGDLVAEIIDDTDRLEQMRAACVSLARPDAAGDIARAMIGAAS